MTRSKTDVFKEHLQIIIEDTLGKKVSKQAAWDLFKNIQLGVVEFTLNQEDNKLPLAGVGRYEVVKTKPRGTKAGLKRGETLGEWLPDSTLTPWEFAPKFKFYPSVAVDSVVEKYFNLGDHDVELPKLGLYSEAIKEEPIGVEKSVEEQTEEVEEAPIEEASLGDIENLF